MANNTKVPRSIKLDSELNGAVDLILELNNESFNSFASEAIREKIEDIIDVKILEKAIEENKDQKLYSVEEVDAELGF